jgi:hypothetical protein
MTTILSRPDSFDPETSKVLSAAFEAAWAEYCRNVGRPSDKQEIFDTRDLLARRVIQMGRLGERDESVLVHDALSHLAQVRGLPARKK